MPRAPLLFLKVSISALTPEQPTFSMIGKMHAGLFRIQCFTPLSALYTCDKPFRHPGVPRAGGLTGHISPLVPPRCEGLAEAAAVLPSITEQVEDTCHVRLPAAEPGREPCSLLLCFSVLAFHAKVL